MRSVFITGADRGLGLSLCKEFLWRGWRVIAGKYMDNYSLLEDLQSTNKNLHVLPFNITCGDSIANAVSETKAICGGIDMLISNAALIEKSTDPEAVWWAYNVNALGPLRLTEAFLPLMRKGIKRLCYVSSEVASISLMQNRHADTPAYPMSKAAMNMGIRLMHNELFPMGYTFRLFHPGWMKFRKPDGSLEEEGTYDPNFIGEIAAKYFETPLYDENRLVMVDFNGYEWPF